LEIEKGRGHCSKSIPERSVERLLRLRFERVFKVITNPGKIQNQKHKNRVVETEKPTRRLKGKARFSQKKNLRDKEDVLAFGGKKDLADCSKQPHWTLTGGLGLSLQGFFLLPRRI